MPIRNRKVRKNSWVIDKQIVNIIGVQTKKDIRAES